MTTTRTASRPAHQDERDCYAAEEAGTAEVIACEVCDHIGCEACHTEHLAWSDRCARQYAD